MSVVDLCILPLLGTILQSLAREMSGHFLLHFVSVTVQNTSPVFIAVRS